MPRESRFIISGIPQHILQRGNNRDLCFFAEQDYVRYLDDLAIASDKYQCRIHAYVLMANHVHILATPMRDDGISSMMQYLGRRYVRYINKTYKRTGTLWEGRFKSSLIDSEIYLLTCMRYIELNPVRAALVEHPGDYRWSSFGRNAYGKEDKLIENHPMYTNLAESEDDRKSVYRDLFRHEIDDELIHEIRQTLNHELVLGRSYFKDRIKAMTSHQSRSGKSGKPGVKEERASYSEYIIYV